MSIHVLMIRYVGSGHSNVALGGLYLHAVPKPASASACSSPFSGLEAPCGLLGQDHPSARQSSPQSGGIGSDPVFNRLSPLFNAALNMSEWYNSSTDAGEVDPMTGLPYAFFPLHGLKGTSFVIIAVWVITIRVELCSHCNSLF